MESLNTLKLLYKKRGKTADCEGEQISLISFCHSIAQTPCSYPPSIPAALEFNHTIRKLNFVKVGRTRVLCARLFALLCVSAHWG